MKTCLVCSASCADAAPTCSACGEGSFAVSASVARRVAVQTAASEPAPDSEPEQRQPSRNRGRR